ncbi:MAG: hypothetical protein HQK53_01400 [Oligoflexia bacterium]|nr:hypothetical protein [Oligoflexia bacterium]
METVQCHLCNGKMEVLEVLKYNKTLGISFIILGILLSLSLAGIVFGIMFLIIGIVMCSSKKEVWYCSSCQSIIDRGIKE